MNLSDAANVNTAVRKFFATGMKSTNKIYAEPSKDTENWVSTVRPGGKDTEVRNSNAKAGMASLDNNRYFLADDQKTAIEYGEYLYYLKEGIVGNCTEMACVAVYLAHEWYSEKKLSLAAVDNGGDHVFLIVGTNSGWTGKKLSQMNTFKGTCFVIDPWMNIVCNVNAYPVEFSQKMDKWAASGKSVLGGKKIFSARGFYDANANGTLNIINPFDSSPISF